MPLEPFDDINIGDYAAAAAAAAATGDDADRGDANISYRRSSVGCALVYGNALSQLGSLQLQWPGRLIMPLLAGPTTGNLFLLENQL